MAALLGTGHALPVNSISNDELATFIDTSDEWIFSRTGIHARHYVKEETALSLSMESSRKALDAAGLKPEDLGAVVCATFTSDDAVPSLACAIIREFNICRPAFDVNAACSGFIYASKAAMAMVPDKPVLVVGCEIMSRVINFDDRGTCVLVGDGAGAAIFGPSEQGGEILASQVMAYPDEKHSLLIEGLAGGLLDGEGWYFRDRGAKNCSRPQFQMNGAEVYKFATRALANELQTCLASIQLTPDDVDWYVPHQANIRIIKTAAELLKQPLDKFYVNIDRTGNTSAASVIIALDELLRTGDVKRGQLLAMTAFGGGLTSGTLVLRY